MEWRVRAHEDRSRIFDYIAEDNPEAALELDDEIEAKTDALPEHPDSIASAAYAALAKWCWLPITYWCIEFSSDRLSSKSYASLAPGRTTDGGRKRYGVLSAFADIEVAVV